MKDLKSPTLTTILRLFLGLLFIYASIPKIADPAYFATAIQNYQMVPDSLINMFAIILPWMELICGLLLLSGYWIRAAAVLVGFLNLVFIIALTSAVLRGLDIDCGCYGGESSANWSRIIEDLFLLLFSVYIILFPESKWALEKMT
jgi:uncharacterized membrane protein YphA (DoxX/SURF4 family)